MPERQTKGHDICRGLAQNCNERTLTSHPAKRHPAAYASPGPPGTRSGEQGHRRRERRRAIHVLIIRQTQARVNRSLITADDAANMDASPQGGHTSKRWTQTPLYIWQAADWPHWRYDLNALAVPLAEVKPHAQGVLLGRLADVGMDWRDSASLAALTDEVLHTSAIEGELLNVMSVRSSPARRLGWTLARCPGRPASGRRGGTGAERHRDNQAALTAERLLAAYGALPHRLFRPGAHQRGRLAR